MGKGGVLFQHWYDCLHGVVVARKLVAPLRVVDALPCYLCLALSDEFVAHTVQHGHYHFVEQVMPLDVEICCFWCHAEPSQVVLKLVVAIRGIRIGFLELLAMAPHLTVYQGYYALGIVHVEVGGIYDMKKVAHGELAVTACAVIPYVPNKKGIDGA